LRPIDFERIIPLFRAHCFRAYHFRALTHTAWRFRAVGAMMLTATKKTEIILYTIPKSLLSLQVELLQKS